jgi:YcxB-like protein
MEALQATVRYDERRLRGAARTLFSRTYRQFLPWSLPSALALIVLMIVAVASIRYPELRLLGVICAIVIGLDLVWWPYAYYRYLRRFAVFWPGTAILKVSAHGISINLGDRETNLQWSAVKEIFQDSNSILLFVSRAQAIVIPTDGLPNSILKFIQERVPQRSSNA